jgi:hypothetical protein
VRDKTDRSVLEGNQETRRRLYKACLGCYHLCSRSQHRQPVDLKMIKAVCATVGEQRRAGGRMAATVPTRKVTGVYAAALLTALRLGENAKSPNLLKPKAVAVPA